MEKKNIDVTAYLKKVQLLNPTKSLEAQGGFHCSICSATFKSYEILLDHQNSKVHLQNIGYDKKKALAKSDVSSVKARLAALKQAKEAAQKPAEDPEALLEKRLKASHKKADAERRARYEQKKIARRKKSRS